LIDEVVYYGDMTYYDVKLDGVAEPADLDAQRAGAPGPRSWRTDTGGVEPERAGALPLIKGEDDEPVFRYPRAGDREPDRATG
jgi:hypothetical protein